MSWWRRLLGGLVKGAAASAASTMTSGKPTTLGTVLVGAGAGAVGEVLGSEPATPAAPNPDQPSEKNESGQAGPNKGRPNGPN